MISEVISIFGVVVSVIFGATGIYLAVKSRYSGKITFINEQTIELFDAIGNSLDKLAVTYDGVAVNENLVLLNGAFINSGKIDITPDMVEQPITIKLPDGYKWLTGRVIDSNIKANFKQENENTISISTELFRCDEYIRFHALAQLPESEEGESNSNRLKKAIKFQHRIVNTKNIDEIKTQYRKETKKKLRIEFIFWILGSIIMLGFFSFDLYKQEPKVMVYPYLVSDSKVELVKIKVTNDSRVEVVSIESDIEIEESFLDFTKKIKGPPSLRKKELRFIDYVIFAVGMLIILCIILSQIFEYRRDYKLLKIFGKQ